LSQSIIAPINVQHDCITHGCTISGSKSVLQEGRKTDEIHKSFIHKEPYKSFFVNYAATRNYEKLEQIVYKMDKLITPIDLEEKKQIIKSVSSGLLKQLQTKKKRAKAKRELTNQLKQKNGEDPDLSASTSIEKEGRGRGKGRGKGRGRGRQMMVGLSLSTLNEELEAEVFRDSQSEAQELQNLGIILDNQELLQLEEDEVLSGAESSEVDESDLL
jgi:hypothetical protein